MSDRGRNTVPLIPYDYSKEVLKRAQDLSKTICFPGNGDRKLPYEPGIVWISPCLKKLTKNKGPGRVTGRVFGGIIGRRESDRADNPSGPDWEINIRNCIQYKDLGNIQKEAP
jgi:hypothetical protein